MNNGKAKCKILREIRQRIAEENDIPLVTKDCTHQGDCKGTCPKCEAELRYLEQQLEKRQRLGKTVTVAALAATLSLTLTGCGREELSLERKPKAASQVEELEGLVANINPLPDPYDGDDQLMGEPVEQDPNEGDDCIVELEGDVAMVIPADEK